MSAIQTLKWVLVYGEIEWHCGVKSFLLMSKSPCILDYHQRLLKFLQDFLKLGFFPLSFDISPG